jgi:hypothetical protein
VGRLESNLHTGSRIILHDTKFRTVYRFVIIKGRKLIFVAVDLKLSSKYSERRKNCEAGGYRQKFVPEY